MLPERDIQYRDIKSAWVDRFFHRLDAGLFCCIFFPADSFAMPLNAVHKARQEGGFLKR